MEYSKDWKPVQNFFGIPVTFFGPMTDKKIRPVIQLIPSEARALKQSDSELKAFNKTYPEKKKKWLKERKGSLLSLLPAAVEKNAKKENMIVAGLSYRLGENAFTEKTYYLNCKEKLVQLKVLVPLGELKRLSEAEKIVRSFQCDG